MYYPIFPQRARKIDKRALQTVEQNNIHKLEYAKAELQVSIDQIITAASSLSNNGLLHQAILNPTQENLENVSYLWLLVAKTQGVYSQLRFIDSQGMERFVLTRVNYDLKSSPHTIFSTRAIASISLMPNH